MGKEGIEKYEKDKMIEVEKNVKEMRKEGERDEKIVIEMWKRR